nr:immunoglobulin heavy chain junction region [Macaca mulatta]MOW33068.1 immunoglobulin heavy chain junction region [Macaca mulatta]
CVRLSSLSGLDSW